LEQVLAQFLSREESAGRSSEPYREQVKRLVANMNNFKGAPFTLQRLTEIALRPDKHYTNVGKLLSALEKLIAVTSTLQPVAPDSPLAQEILARMSKAKEAHDMFTESVMQYFSKHGYIPDGVNAETEKQQQEEFLLSSTPAEVPASVSPLRGGTITQESASDPMDVDGALVAPNSITADESEISIKS